MNLGNTTSCNKCSEPLQPWEMATCEPCLLAQANSLKSQNSVPFTVDTNGKIADNHSTGRKVRTGKQRTARD